MSPEMRILENSSLRRVLDLMTEKLRLLWLALRKIPKHPLFRLTLIGLAIRLLLAPTTQFGYDPVVWYSTGNDMLAGLSPYDTKTYSYPPFWAYTFFPFLQIAARLVDPRTFAIHLSQMDWISLVLGYYSSTVLSPVFLLTIRLPLIIGDIALGGLVFRMVKGYSGFSTGRKAYIFWLFNPLVIWTSSIHGAFDVLPALFTVISLMTLLRGRYLPSGMSLAIAVLYKLYPLYLLPLYAVLVWTDLGRDRTSLGISRLGLKRLSILVLGGLVPFLAALPFVSFGDILHAVFTRETYLSSIGGISPWMLNFVPGLGAIKQFAASNLQAIQLTSTLFAFGTSFLAGLSAVRNRTPTLKDLLRAQILSLAAIYVTLTTVQPQYVEWILPFITISMFTFGLYKIRATLLSVLATIFQVSLSGPLIFLPLVYLGLGPNVVTDPVRSVLSSFGSGFNPSLVISGILGGAILLSLLSVPGKRLIQAFPVNAPLLPSCPRIPLKELRESLRAGSTILLTAFIISMTVSAVLWHTSTAERFFPTSINSRLAGNTLTTQDSFIVSSGNLPLQINLVAAPLASLATDKSVFIYYDPRYPAFNGPRGWIGIADHLSAELRLRGFSGQIQEVNASSLRQVLIQNYTSVVVIPSGVLPSTVENATIGLVGNWIRSGGTLAWMGGPLGYYSDASREQSLDPAKTDLSIAVSPQTRILGYSLNALPVNSTARIATINTSFSSALNLTYSDVWVAPTLGLLKSVGGVAIGHLQNSTELSRSSESIIPIGLGKLILFGGPVTSLLTADGEDAISHDLAQILSLGEISIAAGVGFVTYTFPAQSLRAETFTASFNVTSLKVTGIVLAAFSNYGFSRLYWRMAIPATY